MNKDYINQEFTSLENRIWKTYQSRIKSATRLLKNSQFLDHMSAYYSISLAIFSVISMIYINQNFNLANVIISIALLGLIFYGSSQNYKDRYIQMKDNYLKMGALYYKLVDLKMDNKINRDSFAEIYEEYTNLLNITENHLEYDYFKYLLCDNQTLNKRQERFFRFESIKIFFLKGIVVVVPVVLAVYAILLIIQK